MNTRKDADRDKAVKTSTEYSEGRQAAEQALRKLARKSAQFHYDPQNPSGYPDMS